MNMTIIASDDFAGIGTATVQGRTLNNALGGAGMFAWSGDMFGDGAGSLTSTSSSSSALASIPGATRVRVRVDPNGGSDNTILWFGLGESGPENAVALLLVGQTSLRVSSFTAGARTDHAQIDITAPGVVFWMEVEVAGLAVTCRLLNDDLSVRNTVTHTFTGSVPKGGDRHGFGYYLDGATSLLKAFVAEQDSVADTTPPTLTTPTAAVTSPTTATGSVTTTEAGPAWAVMTTTATTPTAAQIKAGQNSAGAASPAATATLVSGANSAAFSFTGLTPATGYYLHITQDDTATPANTATPVTAAMVTTSAPVVITLPALKNNTGTLLANEVGATVHVYAVATGNKVVTKTAQTSDASGVMAVTDAALVAATEYRCVIVLASGAEGLQKATAA